MVFNYSCATSSSFISKYTSEFEYKPETHPQRNPSCWLKKSLISNEMGNDWLESLNFPTDDNTTHDSISPIEIRATLAPCPIQPDGRFSMLILRTHRCYIYIYLYFIYYRPAESFNYTELNGSASYTGADNTPKNRVNEHNIVQKCRQKIVITLKLYNSGKVR